MRYLKVLVISLFLVLALLVPTLVKAQTPAGGLIAEMLARLDALEAENASQAAEIAALESSLSLALDLDPFLSVDPDPINGLAGPHVIFEGANVHIRSGSGSTNDDTFTDAGEPILGAVLSGLGNLVVGYNENGVFLGLPVKDQTGSHNVIISAEHSYTSFGGFVAGIGNTISGPNSSVSGGAFNTASGTASWVSGGVGNTASGFISSVSGGSNNEASGDSTSVSGGVGNTASGPNSSVSGGEFNLASGGSSSVSGGEFNLASGGRSSVIGGSSNTASGGGSSVSGGENNTASGGVGNTAGNSSVSGGIGNVAEGSSSSVSGGENNTASGGENNMATGASVSGGMGNVAEGASSSVSGGFERTVSGENDWRAGDQFEDF